jgi:hypothetical protein
MVVIDTMVGGEARKQYMYDYTVSGKCATWHPRHGPIQFQYETHRELSGQED